MLTFVQSATLLSLVSAVNLVVFLVILPAATSVLKKRAGWSTTTINIYVARVSSALLVSGAVILSAASTLGFVILGKGSKRALNSFYIILTTISYVYSVNRLRRGLRCKTLHSSRPDLVRQLGP
jgi:hypothetical protein